MYTKNVFITVLHTEIRARFEISCKIYDRKMTILSKSGQVNNPHLDKG